jgi:hypothetical protein
MIRDIPKKFDNHEFRLALEHYFGGPGQFFNRKEEPAKFGIPLADSTCKAVITFNKKGIESVERGPSCSPEEWESTFRSLVKSTNEGPVEVGREISFSSYRVNGAWRGEKTCVQILPPPPEAPLAPVEGAEHPFLLEFPVKKSDVWRLTNHRRIREHRFWTNALNLFLIGRTNFHAENSRHCWATVEIDGKSQIRWVQPFYFAKIGKSIHEHLSNGNFSKLESLNPVEYYDIFGIDGKELRVPMDLDDSLYKVLHLKKENKEKFVRASFWMELSSRQWYDSLSASFSSLVISIEALTERGANHKSYCDDCKATVNHEAPGAAQRFRDFFEVYAPGSLLEETRSKMYSMRSKILHGSDLMLQDQGQSFGWDPPSQNQRDMIFQLSKLSKVAIRNWVSKTSALK